MLVVNYSNFDKNNGKHYYVHCYYEAHLALGKIVFKIERMKK